MLKKPLLRVSQSALVWSFLTVGLRVAGAILILPLVLRRLPPSELGLWYIFLSIGGLAGLLDGGFNPTVTRVAGYIWAGARQLKPMGMDVLSDAAAAVPEPNYALLANLRTTMRCYYWILSLVVFALMLSAGSWWIWLKTADADNRLTLRAAWFAFSFTAACNTFGAVWSSLLSGINGVRQVERLYFGCLIANYIAAVIGLESHLGIWALVVAQFISASISRIGGKILFQRLAGASLSSRPGRLDWVLFKTLWPMAWRNGAVSIGAFLILNANTLVCSAFLGLAVTASYGLTLQIINLLLSTSAMWLNIKLPMISQFRISGRLREVTRLFIVRVRWSLLTYLGGALGLLAFGHLGLALIHARTDLVASPILIVLLLVYFLELQHTCYASLVVSENVNPFLAQALISGVATVSLSLILTPRLGLWGIVLSFGAVQLCCNNWWPVWRGIRGLKLGFAEYWRLFFSLTTDGF